MRTTFERLTLQALMLAALAMLAASPGPVRADVLLYRGDHVYVLPQRLVKRMLELASRDEWRHFNQLNRDIDSDGDGNAEFHAIALGSAGGYGVQVRYRVHPGPDPDSRRLGRWYWGVITNPDNSVLMEAFNL